MNEFPNGQEEQIKRNAENLREREERRKARVSRNWTIWAIMSAVLVFILSLLPGNNLGVIGAVFAILLLTGAYQFLKWFVEWLGGYKGWEDR